MNTNEAKAVYVLARAIAKANAKASGPTRRVQLEIHEAEALRDVFAELIEAARPVCERLHTHASSAAFAEMQALRAALARCGVKS